MQKDIIFVIDTSGSMKGKKIEQAKSALKLCLNSLQDDDRFNIITFATAVNAFNESLLRANSANIDRAMRFVSKIEARGGTAIDAALSQALDTDDSDRPQMIIFMTDGEPTIGETDIPTILAMAKDRNNSNLRIFPFGVGYDVNTHLLDRLSDDNRGTVEYIKPEESIETKVASFFNKVSYPVLTDISLDFASVNVNDLYPQNLPDIFHGSQLVLMGRYEGDGSSAVRLHGRTGEGSREFTYEGRFAGTETDFAFIPRLWASRKIAYLISEIRLHGENRELIDEVVQLSKEHGIVTPYTSYLIVEEAPREVADMMLDESAMTAPAMEHVAGAMKKSSGEDAFEGSWSLRREKEVAVIQEPKGAKVKYIGDKTFYKANGGWRDAGISDGTHAIEITFLSDKYFKLLKKYPEIGKFFSLGPNTTFEFNNKVYRVTA